MSCDICGKASNHTNPLHCITCARSYLEQPRIELARTLIEKERVEKHVKAVVEGSEDKASQHVSLVDSKGGLLVDRQECTNNIELQRTKAETTEINERMGLIDEQVDLLKSQMDETRRRIEELRASNAQRKSDMSSVAYGVDSRRANELNKVRQIIKKTDYESNRTHQDTVEIRTYLCGTAARLAGLKISRRRSKEDGGIKEVYCIGPGTRIRIVDLRELNDAPPDQLSASLAAVAQLVVRVAGYLGVRLPAEITLPHNDYPQPTIFSPASSYSGKRIPFPGSTPSHSSSTSPEASRMLDPRVHLPKPRTLYLDRPLSHLSDEDAPAYSTFLEGVSLLAYDVAWLCRTQGMKDEFEQWEDVCSIGRNLYRLLVLQETKLAQRPENPLDKDVTPAKSNSRVPIRKTPVGFGELSHTASHSFLSSAENAQYLSGWALTPTKITDELKKYLYAEQQNLEWDKLDTKEWEGMENLITDDPVLVGDRRRDNTGLDDGGDRARGVKGWTRVKSRNDDNAKIPK
ncbi:hypothetical protein CC80DRAFT_527671 [Byssothecium circinans]|uniref:Autophagy-related protein 14 n=1 Tax=Byssothecium circinans TaxID=147558 RepID=A0A6A5TAQ7_9PLEO|nr:hypothetical protein CC80DRAFT_458636 [Byssothecium circinans]KAF1952813.1 hypothetical protein CC80DRAFT_527671 [Byssothecium circinans]